MFIIESFILITYKLYLTGLWRSEISGAFLTLRQEYIRMEKAYNSIYKNAINDY